jgi:hypothetical protein
MKINVFLFFTIFICTTVFANQASLEELRSLYNKSATSEEICTNLIKLCNEQSSIADATRLGYKGCATLMMANHYFNPISKWNSFTEGKKILEAAIKADTTNLELRYLRLTIQKNAPSFLGYNINIEEDKQFLKEHFPSIKDEQLKSIIINYLKTI